MKATRLALVAIVAGLLLLATPVTGQENGQTTIAGRIEHGLNLPGFDPTQVAVTLNVLEGISAFDQVRVDERMIDLDGTPIPGTYVTGWIKRGPIGLIGHTKSDAAQTVAHLLSDLDQLPVPESSYPDALLTHLADRGVEVVTWDGFERLDAHEVALGEAAGRERIKVVAREEMLRATRG